MSLDGDCDRAEGQWQCILPYNHKGDHVLGNKFNFRQSRTVPQDEVVEKQPQCPNKWTNLRCTKHEGHEGECFMQYDFDYVEFAESRQEERKKMTPIALPAPTDSVSDSFPFTLDDLDYWVVKRKDGIVAKYVVVNEKEYNDKHPQKIGEVRNYPSSAASAPYVSHFSDICKHPGEDVIWEGKNLASKPADLALHILNAPGMRDNWKKFDTVIDCGHILNLEGIGAARLLRGSEWLVDSLEQYGYDYVPNILRIDWDDREAPLLDPAFWPALVKMLVGKTAIACQGGHGRSGTGLVCMMLALTPDYTPYDAVCHLRAMHCGRAIESKTQHEYIDEVGKFLGRTTNVGLVSGVKDFKAAFLKIDKASAKPYQERLRNVKVTK